MKRPRTRKLIVMVLLLLTSGTIVNVAVAWAIAYRLPVDEIRQAKVGFTEHPGRLVIQSQGTGTHVLIVVADAQDQLRGMFRDAPTTSATEVPGWSKAAALNERSATTAGFPAIIDVARGWPFRSLATTIEGMFNGEYFEQVTYSHCIYWDRPARASEIGHRTLPLRIIWPGFAINTVFYAAVLWVLFAGRFALRRIIRRRRGLCPACAYPVGGSPVCTECGEVLKCRGSTSNEGIRNE